MHCGNYVFEREISGYKVHFIAGHCPGCGGFPLEHPEKSIPVPVVAGFDVSHQETVTFIRQEPQKAVEILLEIAENETSIRAYHVHQEGIGDNREYFVMGIGDIYEPKALISGLEDLKRCTFCDYGDRHARIVAGADFMIAEATAFMARKEQKKLKEARKLKAAKGFVYLLFLECTGHHKIGRSNNPDRRIWTEIGPALPEKPELVCVIETEDMYELETALHKRFSDKRANGEWFRLDDEDIEYIEQESRRPHQ